MPFSFDEITRQAEDLAKRPYEKPIVPSPNVLAEITYDEYQRIRYLPDKSLRLDRDGHYPVQLFHLGKYATQPVHIHVVEAGAAREVIYSPELFDIPETARRANFPPERVSPAFASWRTTSRRIGSPQWALPISGRPVRTISMASRRAASRSIRRCLRKKNFRGSVTTGSKARTRPMDL